MPISIRLFWNFFLKLGNGFGLFVSALHEAGSLLLFFLAPSCFLLSFFKGFTCHKTSLSVRGAPVTALCRAHCLFSFRLLQCFFRMLRAWSTCSSAALLVSPMTSEISQ